MEAQSIDKTQVPALHQKRILAFVNHFLISSCSFLNEFAAQCEEKFIVLERKMQKVEAALTIIEAKLSSIPDLPGSNELAKTNENTNNESTISSTIPNAPTEINTVTDNVDTTSTATNVENDAANVIEDPPPVTGVKASEDVRYKKFFKMVQFGVPSNAVKIKMQVEGVDPKILDTPNVILPDGVSS